MGRPDLSEIRRNEILDALERCVARAGLAEASLDKIAQEAGMKRQIIRHYLGNREDVVRAFGRRLIGRYHDDIGVMTGSLPSENRVGAMVEMLLMGSSEGVGGSAASVLLIEALISESDREPEFRELVSGYIEALTGAVADELATAYPDAGHEEVHAVAYGLVGLCFNHESLKPLRLPSQYHSSTRLAALRLVSTLADR